MANRSFLLCDDSLTFIHNPAYPTEGVLAAGTYIVPLFWFSLFTPDLQTIRKFPILLGNGDDANNSPEIIAYPILASNAPAAKSLFLARLPIIKNVLPTSLHSTADEFAILVASIDRAYVKLEPYEIWEMDPATYTKQTDFILRTFAQPTAQGVAAIFEAFQISPDTPSTPCGYRNTIATALRGHEWERPVPWKD